MFWSLICWYLWLVVVGFLQAGVAFHTLKLFRKELEDALGRCFLNAYSIFYSFPLFLPLDTPAML
jgi:hypothetical protein